jgi:hypothetical protein
MHAFLNSLYSAVFNLLAAKSTPASEEYMKVWIRSFSVHFLRHALVIPQQTSQSTNSVTHRLTPSLLRRHLCDIRADLPNIFSL